MALKKCKSCGQMIDSGARKCPHCGKTYTTLGGVVVAIIVGLVLWAILSRRG